MITYKSREITSHDWFKNLQLEWMAYSVRINIYEREHDLKKFSDILNGKKLDIDKFSLRNSIPSIFTSDEKLSKYIFLLYPKTGCNKNILDFQYSPFNRKTYEIFDNLFFYKHGSDCILNDEKCFVEYNDPIERQLIVATNNGTVKVSYCDVRKDILHIFNTI